MAIFERKPYAQVETFHPAFLRGVRFRHVREFLRKYEAMVDRERGACTCESDEIETETIDGSGVISGVYVPRRRQREWMDDDRACHIRSFDVGEAASLSTEVPGRGFLRTSALRRSRKS